MLTPTFIGTYTVSSDCTGSVTVNSNLGLTLHDAIVVTRGGRATVKTQIDPFVVVSRTLETISN